MEIALTPEQLLSVDISAAMALIEPLLADPAALAAAEQSLEFKINFPQDPGSPLELSEIPEVRLWFIRLDALYPWLPFLLNWRSGELARYTAMLVPHQFHSRDGILYNPEALEIFVMHRVCGLAAWLKSQGLEPRERLKNMTQMLGYELDDGFFELLGS
jgi:hypothetical protein